jgi:hypothetical protein
LREEMRKGANEPTARRERTVGREEQWEEKERKKEEEMEERTKMKRWKR